MAPPSSEDHPMTECFATVRVVLRGSLVLPAARFVVGTPTRARDVLVVRHVIGGGRRGALRSEATYVRTSEPLDREAAEARLRRWRTDRDDRDAWVTAAYGTVNLALRAYRIGLRDPYVVDVTDSDVAEVVLGCATAEQAAEGEEREALAPIRRRPERLDLTERARAGELVAQGLSGDLPLLEADELLAFAAREANHGREGSARAAISAAIGLVEIEVPCGRDLVRALNARLAASPEEPTLVRVATLQDLLDRWRRGATASS